MEDLVKKLESIFNQFKQEEFGNRLSQFAIIGLTKTILGEIKVYESIIKDNKKENKKKE